MNAPPSLSSTRFPPMMIFFSNIPWLVSFHVWFHVQCVHALFLFGYLH